MRKSKNYYIENKTRKMNLKWFRHVKIKYANNEI